MQQTLVRPSSIKARKIPSSGPIVSGSLVIKRRRVPMTMTTQEQFTFDRIVREGGARAPVPFGVANISGRMTCLSDAQRLEMYRRLLIGSTLADVSKATGISKALTWKNTGYVLSNFEVVGK